jgi:NitT/TauT family transport system permease protein
LSQPLEASVAVRPRPQRGVLRSIRKQIRYVGPAVVVGLIITGTFQAIAKFELLPSILFPPVEDVFLEMYRQAFTSTLWMELSVTMREAIAAWVIGSGIGFIFGVGIGLFPWVSRGAYPYMVLLQSMPRITLAPAFIAMFGFGMTPKVLMGIVLCFFPVLINTIVGLRSADPDSLLLMRSMKASKFQIFRKLLLPGAMPMISGGLKAALSFALIGAIVGEMFAGNEGMGGLINTTSFQLRMDAMFGFILWTSLVSLALFGIMTALDRKFIFWTENPSALTLGDDDDASHRAAIEQGL